ncbi:TPA: phage tail spike protein [Streptococcus pyogenes]|uniref:phage tail spike protein n=1 Tax=Streptococcus pyogenes TaxID=1314 RepID=UPI0001E10267|nr:phage tail spike protein [Streptococcus pyogenes]HER4515964.1 phage tail protein [Streptococcus pyogenes NGAS743]HER4524750.1 phage tail protein [Streptococcus pyogenes NGAS747]HER4528154.1 phage tail protein [Streptococcus pyogenes NGAS739]HER4539692.1 phage tail protein [Streptococcus pyogenes NGAS668]HER4543114.1 phage tail protein [Streptococcus pyogenes NGAS669]HER4551764.1 phage tail protein [Streptococcus pyogenes NGAS662]HER4555459.1 phage tail protein [Streptococcus pyogenes NGAS
MIYLFDKLEQLIATVGADGLLSWHFKVKNNDWDQASFEVPIDYDIEPFVYFGFFHKVPDEEREVFKLFKVIDYNLEDSKFYKGLDKAESDLDTIAIIKDKRFRQSSADACIDGALKDTGYQVGKVEGITDVRTLSYYYISPRAALIKVVEAFNCEFNVRYTFINNKITSRHIDLKKRFGKPTGKQFEHGNNLLKVVYEESTDDIVTCLIGRGKGEEIQHEVPETKEAEGHLPQEEKRQGYGRRIEFTDIVWSVKKGDPIDKPAGQNFVALDSAKEEYGLSQNGELKPRWGVFVNEEIEDKTELLKATWDELQRLSIPIRIYKAEILDIGPETWKGDSVAIIYDEVKIAFETRVDEIDIDKLNFNRSVVTLGDYSVVQNREAMSRKEAVQNMIDESLETITGLGVNFQEFLQDIEKRIETGKKEMEDNWRKVNLEFDNFKKKVEQEGLQFNTLKEQIKEVDERTDKELDEFRETLKNLALPEEAIKKITDAIKVDDIPSIKQSFDDLKNKVSETSETSRLNAEIIGTDGKTRYNKNLLVGDPNRVKTYGQDYIEVEANDGGFKRGETYTISFSQTCELLQKVAITLTQANNKGVKLVLTPTKAKMKSETFTLIKDTEVINVYPLSYSATLSGTWYKSKQIDLNASEVQNMALEMSYKEVVDGKDAAITGTWSDSPQIILDGGKK